MYEVLVRLIVAASLLQIGINLTKSAECPSMQCLVTVEKASRKVLKIDWRPISVFPEEAAKFQPRSGNR